MYLKEKHKGLDRTLWGIRQQVIDSLDYVAENFPPLNSPEEIFTYCKLITTYEPDPKGVELVQTVQTLLDDNWHNKTGAGDCDDLTVLTIACCVVNGFNQNYIFLCGRNKRDAVHIYSGVKYKGKIYTLDLTNTFINQERKYPFCQILEL